METDADTEPNIRPSSEDPAEEREEGLLKLEGSRTSQENPQYQLRTHKNTETEQTTRKPMRD